MAIVANDAEDVPENEPETPIFLRKQRNSWKKKETKEVIEKEKREKKLRGISAIGCLWARKNFIVGDDADGECKHLFDQYYRIQFRNPKNNRIVFSRFVTYTGDDGFRDGYQWTSVHEEQLTLEESNVGTASQQ